MTIWKTLLLVALVITASPAVAQSNITILGLFKDKVVLRVDSKQRVLEVGEVSPEGIRLLAANSQEAILEINGQRVRRTLDSHIDSNFAVPQRPKVQIWPDQGMYRVVGSINGTPVNFLVDTGATAVTLDTPTARRLGIDFRLKGEQRVVRTASDLAIAHRVILDRVKIGEIELRQVEAMVLEGTTPSQALLGMSFLGRLEMRNKGQMLELQKKF